MIPRLFRSCRSFQTLGKTLTPLKPDPSALSRTFSSKNNDGDDEKKFPPDGFSVNKDAGTYKKWSFSSEIESEDGKFDFFGKIQDPGENNVPRFEEEPFFRRPESSGVYERGVVSVEEEWTGGKGDANVDRRVKDQGISRGDEEEMREGFETWNLEEKSEDWAFGKVFEDLRGEEEGSGDLSEGVETGASELAKQYAEEEGALTAILKGRSHAFGDLIAASGITEDMLDSYLKDLRGVQGLPPMSVIDEIRQKEGEEMSTGQQIEYKKQEELSKSRVRVVDEKGRAYGTGRRKCSVARVWIQPGEGEFIVNDKSIDVYFPILDHRAHLLQPFSETKTIGMWDVRCTVKGGGVSGQAGAIRLGISRALQNWEPGFRPELRSAGLLTRDSRAVERKKPGKAKARKSFQWVKR